MSKLDDYIEKPKYEHLAKAYDALEAQLSACAAGPWRYDVENAPKDNEMGIMFATPSYTAGRRWQIETYHWSEYVGLWLDSHNHTWHDAFAFAVPNPPQVTP